MDIFDKCTADSFGYFHDARDFKEMNPKLSVVIDGAKTSYFYHSSPVIVWSYNNYLGLSNHPSNREIEKEFIQDYSSTYPMGSRFLTGNCQDLDDLEIKFAEHIGKESALLFATGYLGAIGTIPAIAQQHDIIIMDAEAHACLFDGARIAVANGAKLLLFKHNDVHSLENKLKIAQQDGKGGILIITDGIFSMKGDAAPLKEITDLKKKYSARLLLDDAHGGGVLGGQGQGTAHALGVTEDVDLILNTFSKAFGSSGGIVSGNKDAISFLKFNARTNIFSHNMTAIHARKALNSLALIKNNPDLLANLWKITTLLQTSLRENGFNIGDTQSPITPVFIQKDKLVHGVESLYKMIMTLRNDYGVFVSGVTYPAVPKDSYLLRLIPTAIHTEEDVRLTVDALQRVVL